jgi:hypothetical protein
MVWATFSAKSKTPICWITTKMNSADYTKLLDDVSITYMDEQMNENALLAREVYKNVRQFSSCNELKVEILNACRVKFQARYLAET